MFLQHGFQHDTYYRWCFTLLRKGTMGVRKSWCVLRRDQACGGVTHVVHQALFCSMVSLGRGLGAGTSCPKLVMGRSSERVVLQESPDILRFADKNIRNEEDRLYPDDPDMQRLVQAWGTEWRFDKQLGPHVRRWSYCYLLFEQCSYDLLTQGAPMLERVFGWILMPVLRRIVYGALYCNKPGAKERSLQVVEAIFKEVDELLADGRPYICGRRFTAADMTFAALGGPMVSPPQYGAWLPGIEDCPTDMALTMESLRMSPAGRHILKIYDTKRHRLREVEEEVMPSRIRTFGFQGLMKSFLDLQK
ncbi:uncharacterized protein [Physcomitrium patens]|uniref:GST C-terminal domain-containing protein n=2 Tax=Physcomitrium patens TaxID=3218 RepID=A0A7I4C6D4_PHYPA|nr:uncharacterized protein LOC112273081 isoform X2 [Physcomitrium patens]XP_024357218.1 uncharacterized protein LOC112273081 isoform X2 [Physcomitrium patens]|eukprot:XP_024357217.1 uncharacterized protein LOC112273081 isoform X2 [Physcomitrella patens]